MTRNQRGIGLAEVVWSVAGLLVAIAAGYYLVGQVRERTLKFTTPYQAVLLTNGSVYFGKLHDYGSPHPVLAEVYYIVSQTDPSTKQVNNVLIKRGKELHEPDRMYLNPSQILFVEPVGIHSKVAELISQAH